MTAGRGERDSKTFLVKTFHDFPVTSNLAAHA